MKDELNEFLGALGERNRGVIGEAATFLGLKRATNHTYLHSLESDIKY